jgi:choline transport protein
MSDEVKDAPRKVPQSMVLSVLINGFMSFTFMIAILFTLGDPELALTAPTGGYPIIYIIHNATKSRIATGFMIAMILWNGLLAFFGALASTSRLTWASARDGGLPLSSIFGHVQVGLRIRLNSLLIVSFIVAGLQLINIGSTTALYAILSVSTIALYISYMLPILFLLIHRLRAKHIAYGPFKLGPFGILLNIFSLLYGIYILIWLPFPPFLPVTSTNMNYGGPVMGAVILFALVDGLVWSEKIQVPLGIECIED